MSAAVACSPTSPDAIEDACLVSASGLDANDADAYDVTKYPTSPAEVYYFKATSSGKPTLKSHLFTPNGGKHEWFDVIFPAAGTWAVGIFNAADDSSVVSANVTVN